MGMPVARNLPQGGGSYQSEVVSLHNKYTCVYCSCYPVYDELAPNI